MRLRILGSMTPIVFFAVIIACGGGNGEATDQATVTDTGTGCAVCEYAGQCYEAGDSFDAIDGCNTCACSIDGQALCTATPCVQPDEGPSPEDEGPTPGDEGPTPGDEGPTPGDEGPTPEDGTLADSTNTFSDEGFVDVPAAPFDTSTGPPVDEGSPPKDEGSAPFDEGPVPVDEAPAPVDTGPVDILGAPTDEGSLDVPPEPNDSSEGPPADVTISDSPTWSEVIVPKFTQANKCGTCHAGDGSGGHNCLSNYQDCLESASSCPGKTVGACMLDRIIDGSMPPGGEFIPPDWKTELQAWIDAGMPQ